MNTWFALALTMVHTLWIGAIVGVAALASRLVLARASASIRYVVALGWLATLAAVPIVTWACLTPSSTPGRAAAAPPRPAARSVEASFLAQPTPFDAVPAIDGPPASRRDTVERALVRWESVASILPAVWLAGSGAMLIWSLVGLAGAERLRRHSDSVDAHVRATVDRLVNRLGISRVDVLVCPRVAVPILVGILRPAILIPPAILSGLSAREVEMVLLHELAHVRRFDNLANLLQRLIESLLFFHPAVWAVSVWVRHERENCCDDVALAALDDDSSQGEYAGMLLHVHTLATCTDAPAFASAASGGDLVARVRRIVTRHEPMRLSRSSLGALAACAVVSAVVLARSVLAADDVKVLTVEKQGGQFASIQAALDAAPDGATVRVGPGRWEGGLVIKKPITLEGAGWDKTTLVVALPEEARRAAKELAEQVDKGISIGEWKAKLDAMAQKYQTPAVIRASGARDVVIKGLKVAGTPGANQNGSVNPSIALVVFDAAAGSVENCVVAGSPGNGINVTNGSDVRVTHTLVAGVWSVGIQIGSRGKTDKAVIVDSDVRNCYHRCVVIGPGTDVTVERCRVWGTAWHCIRYDDASPVIRGNRLYNTARFGIYASGETHATVTGNLFLASEMEGMSCWFANHDTIEGNTFANNRRGGLTVLGASKPTVRRNLFVENAVGISCMVINGQADKAAGDPQLDGNWFFKNGINLAVPGDKAPVKADLTPDTPSHVAEVHFVGVAKRDFSLPPDSPARAANAGVADPLTEASPFPTQAEEEQIMPDGDSWDYQKWKKG